MGRVSERPIRGALTLDRRQAILETLHRVVGGLRSRRGRARWASILPVGFSTKFVCIFFMIARVKQVLLLTLVLLTATAQILPARAQEATPDVAPTAASTATPTPTPDATPLALPSAATLAAAAGTATASSVPETDVASTPSATNQEFSSLAPQGNALTTTLTATSTPPPAATASVTVATPALAVTQTVQPADLDAQPTITATLTASTTLSQEEVAAQLADQELDARVETIFAGMTVADRVGQLFIVTFQGNDTSFESEITELIYGYRIGGVVLSPENGNFSNQAGTDTPRSVAVLANQLQSIAYGVLLPADQALQPVPNQPWPPSNLVSLEREIGVQPPNIPLLIGVQQSGDNLPGTSLRRGFTPLPSQLAIGSTWNPDTATGIGEIVGRELGAVGINLLLGPSLNLVDQPRTDEVGSLGSFSFGGDPYWVGRMAKSYITGVHQGSDGRVATIAGNFPGQGDVDRLPDEEVATIQRTATELEKITLPPFQAVTRSSRELGDDLSLTDGLMTSHMRFGALQAADGRNTPISLDPELNSLTTEQAGDWREQGGVMMTGPLGVPAIRRYYDPNLTEFPARRVALDAFTAGHDLLFLSRFALNENWDSQLDNYRATIAFFQERYRSDLAFAAQVDASVKRILKLKLRLYADGGPTLHGEYVLPVPLSEVLVQESNLAVLPTSDSDPDPVPAQAAREAVTVLYPNPANDALPAAPQAGEKIVIFTDSRLQRECATCTAEAAIDPDAIARTILSLYGPDATGQIAPESLTSMTFSELSQLLNAQEEASGVVTLTPGATATSSPLGLPTPTPRPTAASSEQPEGSALISASGSSLALYEQAIAEADWLIFAMLDYNPTYANSDALRRFLRLRPEEVEEKRIVVFSLNAPWFLDATEISKLNAYFGVYSKTAPFLESAVRALFRSFTPNGAPSVSAPNTRFSSLSGRLVPNPARTLPVQIYTGANVQSGLNSTTVMTSTEGLIATNSTGSESIEQDTGPAVVNAGSTLHVEVGPVLDLNGNIVPDGTPVNLVANFEGAELAMAIEPALTRNGRAVRDLLLERGGVLRLVATAGSATSGDAITINVLETVPANEVVTTPLTTGQDITAPVAPAATLVVTTSAPSTTSTLPGALTPTNPLRITDGARVNGISLLLSLFTMAVVLGVVYLAQMHVVHREKLFTAIVWSVILGLASYVLFALGWFPGSDALAASLNFLAAPLVVFVAILTPLVALQLRVGRFR